MTIAQRIVTLEMMAKAANGVAVKQMLQETARVLEGQAVVYNELYNAAVDAVQRSNGEDPAMNIIVDMIRKQRGELPPNYRPRQSRGHCED